MHRPSLMVDMACVSAYQIALNGIRAVVAQRKWDDLEKNTDLLHEAREKLRDYLNHHDMDGEVQRELVQLSIQHRRVMRQLHEQMQLISEDLSSVDSGLRHISMVKSLEISL